MRRMMITGALVAGLAGAAAAHQGAMGAVKARMDGMGVLQQALRSLGPMAKGQTAFDAAIADALLAAVAKEARAIPELFEARDLSGPTEALPAIWQDWEDFAARAEALAQAAERATGAADADGLRTGLRAVGQACSGCHEPYRQP